MKQWVPAIAASVCLALGAGLIGIYGFFVPHLSAEFGVGAATINIGPVALLLVPGIVAPIIGRQVDRLPIRLILMTGVAIAMGALVAVSRAPSLVLAAAGFALFALGIALYGPVVVNGLLVKIYPGREARALAIAAMGISVSTVILPPLAGVLLEALSWRTALALLAAALALVLSLTVWLGLPPVHGGAGGANGRVHGNVYRQPAFWLIGACVALALNGSIILAICYPPWLQGMGYSAAQAGGLVAVVGGAGLLGKALIAVLGDAARGRVKVTVVVLLLAQASGLLLLLSGTGHWSVLLGLALAGAGGGGMLPMHPFLNSRYYPPEIIGQVNGAQMPLFLPLGLVGPPLAGYIFDTTGSYDGAAIGVVAILVIAAGLALLLPPVATARATGQTVA